MLVHTVFFWLKKELTPDQRAQFQAGLETLKDIEDADTVYIGTPSATPERPVIDSSYDYCLTVILKDIPSHDAYQDHPIHHAFIENCKEFWTEVKVYDAD